MTKAITNSSSFSTTGNDDGNEHILRHEKEEDYRKYKKYDAFEEGVLILHGDPDKHTREQALEKAYEQGLLSEEEWQKKNEKKKPSRRQESYREYLESTSSSLKKQLEKNLKTGGKNKEQSRQQLTALNYNEGLAIHGNLYYLGDVDNYKEDGMFNSAEYIKKYRKFEVATFADFYHSDIYQALHKNTQVRAEIHTDEAGAIHLQTSDVYFKANSRGRVQVSKNSIREENLKDLLGADEFERLLKREKFIAKKEKEKERTLTGFDIKRISDSDFENEEITNKERAMYMNRLFRRVENDKLEEIALEVSKEYGVFWDREYDVSDKKYLPKEVYKAVQSEKSKNKETASRLGREEFQMREKRAELDEREEQIAKETENLYERQRRLFDVAERKADLAETEAYLNVLEIMNPDLTYMEYIKADEDRHYLNETEEREFKREGITEEDCHTPISEERGRKPFKVFLPYSLKKFMDRYAETYLRTKVGQAINDIVKRNKEKITEYNVLKAVSERVNFSPRSKSKSKPSKGYDFER